MGAFAVQKTCKTSLCEIVNKTWVRAGKQKLSAPPNSLRVINQQLWCCCDDSGMAVFDSELKEQKPIKCAVKAVNDVAKTRCGELVLASDKGLFQITTGKPAVVQ